MSQRRACRVLGAQRRTMRYRRRTRSDEAGVRERLRALAAERPRWGYRRLHILLKRELGRINRKRVQRLYRLEGTGDPPTQAQARGAHAAGHARRRPGNAGRRGRWISCRMCSSTGGASAR